MYTFVKLVCGGLIFTFKYAPNNGLNYYFLRFFLQQMSLAYQSCPIDTNAEQLPDPTTSQALLQPTKAQQASDPQVNLPPVSKGVVP